ncbi:ATP-binding protein, partial [Nostoc sp.]|uniref:ATP-binding protein n=1 Tax=Nostoc sp. TaxID=1180 RepID=UPI002FF83099
LSNRYTLIFSPKFNIFWAVFIGFFLTFNTFGLGLSISYQIIVEKHGGILNCLSESGKGTEFWIQIPI